MKRDLFVYGLLMFPELLQGLTQRRFASEEALLRDHVRLTVRHPRVPPIGAVIGASGKRVDGVLLRGVDPQSLALLDRFEGLSEALYTRCERTVMVANGQRVTADVYLCGARIRAHLAGPWDVHSFRSADYAHYRDVVVPAFVREHLMATE